MDDFKEFGLKFVKTILNPNCSDQLSFWDQMQIWETIGKGTTNGFPYLYLTFDDKWLL